MITSANIVNMRALFDDPELWIAEAVANAVKFGYDGYDSELACLFISQRLLVTVDFEPESNVTAADAPRYEAFLDRFAKALHSAGRTLSGTSPRCEPRGCHIVCLAVDIASWGPLWNFTALAQTAVDHFHTMDTYAGNCGSCCVRVQTWCL